jgi:hypothetical protein
MVSFPSRRVSQACSQSDEFALESVNNNKTIGREAAPALGVGGPRPHNLIHQPRRGFLLSLSTRFILFGVGKPLRDGRGGPPPVTHTPAGSIDVATMGAMVSGALLTGVFWWQPWRD